MELLKKGGYPQERHIDNERNMNRDTRSCPFCKTQASVNARFGNKCGKPLKLSIEAGSMAKPVFYKENAIQNTSMSAPSVSYFDNPSASAATVSPDRVCAEFLHAWNGYKQYAWGHDELKPLSKTYSDWFPAPLLMTPVDAFDTMILMGLTAEAAEAKNLILSRLDFDLDIEVQHFEVVIRILGGLISAQQLDGDLRFLELAIDLADRMLPVFDSNTGMPYRFVNLKTHKTRSRFTNPAEIGTCVLEYGTLSRLTGDPKYFDAAKRAIVALYHRRSRIGLVGTTIDVETGGWLAKDSHVGCGIDSYYEYLLKGAILFDDPELWAMWQNTIAAVNAHVADEASGGLWYGRVNMNTGEQRATVFGALDAFFPAVLALGGDLDRAARLEDSCYKMWTLHGIAPELLDYKTMKALSAPTTSGLSLLSRSTTFTTTPATRSIGGWARPFSTAWSSGARPTPASPPSPMSARASKLTQWRVIFWPRP